MFAINSTFIHYKTLKYRNTDKEKKQIYNSIT